MPGKHPDIERSFKTIHAIGGSVPQGEYREASQRTAPSVERLRDAIEALIPSRFVGRNTSTGDRSWSAPKARSDRPGGIREQPQHDEGGLPYDDQINQPSVALLRATYRADGRIDRGTHSF